MRQNFEFRAILGALIWVGLIAIAIIFARQSFSQAPKATSQLIQFFGNQRRTIEIEMEFPIAVQVGDPVFGSDGESSAPIGVISRVSSLDNNEKVLYLTSSAWVTFFGSAPVLSNTDELVYHAAPESTRWVVETMLPPSKREELRALIMDSYRANQEELIAALKPVIAASLKDASSVVREDLQAAFEARDEQIKKIGQRYQTDLIEKEIVPLVKKEIWPIVQEQSAPLVTKLGQEVWNQVSVFGFGWRYLYDKTPLPDRKLTQREFKRFVDEKAVPILESHMGEIVELQKTLLKKISANPKVKSTVSASIRTIIKDPEVQELLSDVFREVFVKNNRLQTVLEQRWNGPEAKRALAMANKRLEPTITEIGAALFGTPDGDITEEFARVLRHRILHKDSRWFVLKTDPTDTNTKPTLQPKKIIGRIADTQESIPYVPARGKN
ncbi:MAG: hypothetical protein AB8B55_11065 [Mariniblastus sp.]